jgi:ATP-dependent RNA helicase DHX37/DHR1
MCRDESICVHALSISPAEDPRVGGVPRGVQDSKLYMRGITAIEPEWLPMYALARCNLSPPLVDPVYLSKSTKYLNCLHVA